MRAYRKLTIFGDPKRIAHPVVNWGRKDATATVGEQLLTYNSLMPDEPTSPIETGKNISGASPQVEQTSSAVEQKAAPPTPARAPSNLTWSEKRWWNVESGHTATPDEEKAFLKLIEEAREEQDKAKAWRSTARRYGIRDEIRRDVVPFFLLRRKTRVKFLNVRSKMWRHHVETFSLIKNSNDPNKVLDPEKAGSNKIEYVGARLDILDRKFGSLFTVQSLLGVVVSLAVNTFKQDILNLFTDIPGRQIAVAVLGLVFVVFCFLLGASKVEKVRWILLAAVAAAATIFVSNQYVLTHLATGLMILFGCLWLTTLVICLRGAGRARWGEMKDVLAGGGDLDTKVREEGEYQALTLIRALVGRTGAYRMAVLLVFTNIYCLFATGYVTTLALARRPKDPPKQEMPPETVKRTTEERHDVHFGFGETCSTSAGARSEIKTIAEQIAKRDPIGVVIIGAADATSVRPRLAKTVGDNASLAVRRGYCVAEMIRNNRSPQAKKIPIDITTRPSADFSSAARTSGNPDDRVAEVHLLQPIIN